MGKHCHRYIHVRYKGLQSLDRISHRFTEKSEENNDNFLLKNARVHLVTHPCDFLEISPELLPYVMFTASRVRRPTDWPRGTEDAFCRVCGIPRGRVRQAAAPLRRENCVTASSRQSPGLPRYTGACFLGARIPAELQTAVRRAGADEGRFPQTVKPSTKR